MRACEREFEGDELLRPVGRRDVEMSVGTRKPHAGWSGPGLVPEGDEDPLQKLRLLGSQAQADAHDVLEIVLRQMYRILIGVVCETQIGSLPPLVHHRRSFAGIAPFPD